MALPYLKLANSFPLYLGFYSLNLGSQDTTILPLPISLPPELFQPHWYSSVPGSSSPSVCQPTSRAFVHTVPSSWHAPTVLCVVIFFNLELSQLCSHLLRETFPGHSKTGSSSLPHFSQCAPCVCPLQHLWQLALICWVVFVLFSMRM